MFNFRISVLHKGKDQDMLILVTVVVIFPVVISGVVILISFNLF